MGILNHQTCELITIGLSFQTNRFYEFSTQMTLSSSMRFYCHTSGSEISNSGVITTLCFCCVDLLPCRDLDVLLHPFHVFLIQWGCLEDVISHLGVVIFSLPILVLSFHGFFTLSIWFLPVWGFSNARIPVVLLSRILVCCDM